MSSISSFSQKLLRLYERSNIIIQHKQSKHCICVSNYCFKCSMMMLNYMPEAAHQNSACNPTWFCRLPITFVVGSFEFIIIIKCTWDVVKLQMPQPELCRQDNEEYTGLLWRHHDTFKCNNLISKMSNRSKRDRLGWQMCVCMLTVQDNRSILQHNLCQIQPGPCVLFSVYLKRWKD